MLKVFLPIVGVAAALYFDFITFGYKREDRYLDLHLRVNIGRFEGLGKTLKNKIDQLEEK